jgi:hypothetical protein
LFHDLLEVQKQVLSTVCDQNPDLCTKGQSGQSHSNENECGDGGVGGGGVGGDGGVGGGGNEDNEDVFEPVFCMPTIFLPLVIYHFYYYYYLNACNK